MTHITARRKSKASSFSSKKSSRRKISSRLTKSIARFKSRKKRRASKASSFSSKKSSKRFSLKKASLPKKSLVSPFLTRFKSTSSVSKPKKKKATFKKRPRSFFRTPNVAKNTPEVSSFIASSSTTFKRKVGKSAVFSKKILDSKGFIGARLPTTPQNKPIVVRSPAGLLITLNPTISPTDQVIGSTPKQNDTSSPTKNSPSLPSTPEPTSGDDTNFFDDIADFFNNFFGGSGASSQQQASDAGSITTFEFSPVTLPSQDESGVTEIEPKESFGLGLGGVSTDGEGGDKDGILNSIVNDPIKLGLSITAIIGIIAGFTGGK